MFVRPPASALRSTSLITLLTPLALLFAAGTTQAQTPVAANSPDASTTQADKQVDRKLDALLGNTPENTLPPKLYPKWEVGLGFGGFSIPDYRGSDHQSSYLFPFPFFVYRGEILRSDRSGLSGRFLDTDYLDMEFSMSGGAPVHSKNNDARAGMPDLKPTVELGGQAIVRLAGEARSITRLDLRLPVREAITVSENPRAVGWVFTPAINLSYTPRDKWELGVQGGLYYGSAKYHRYLYEVAPQYATDTRPAYTPKAGYGGWQMTTSLSRRFEKMYVGSFVRVSSVSGSVFEDSPLIRRKTNYYAGFGISWILGTSSEMVPATDDD
jgi:outer membrane scaffolding protein for murein synthesis (MipA/OmpV family)